MCELLLEHPAQAEKVDVPARKREAFRENLLLPELHRDRNQLRHRDRRRLGAAEVIHARNMVVPVLRHDRAVAGDLRLTGLLEDVVAGQQPPFFTAPVMDLLQEVFGEEPGDEAPETDAHGIALRRAEE